jgi:2-succinyl-5-enolpyruvyl-6-hydroxy-3-cyclohexene-1-carboxylate synthase
LATAIDFPIFAETASQLRFALGAHPLACPEFTWLLSSQPWRRRLAADTVLCLGATPTCAGFETWMMESGASRYVLCEHESPDPLGTARIIVQGDVATSVQVLQQEVAAIDHSSHSGQRGFAAALCDAGRVCRSLVAEELAREAPLAEGTAVACIARALPNGAQWVLGNSLPIRDVDAYVTGAADLVILSQRGANGIDGLVSGAVGSALGTQRPTLLLLGDVSLLHDIGGLELARRVRTPLVLAVLDNDGGRIFDQLPVHDLYADDARLAQFWRTSPACDFRHAAGLFGLRYASPATESELASATQQALQTNSATLLHVRVGSDSARRVRERVLEGLA